MRPGRILVAGIGNIFLGDDGFGSEVARRLMQRPLPEGVRVADFGIRGLDLTYALLEGFEAVILVDASPRGGLPGTLYTLELTMDQLTAQPAAASPIEAHGMEPVKALQLASAMGGRVDRLLLLGCEPEPPGADDEFQMEMSEPVRAAVDEAVVVIESLVERLRHENERADELQADTMIPGKEERSCRK